jgi:hypothetical protein
MNKLSKEKRDRIILILIGGAGLAIAIWYSVLGSQKEVIASYDDRIESTQDRLFRAERMTRRERQINADLELLRKKIAAAEGQMHPAEEANGRKWLLDQLGAFIQNRYDVTLRALSDPTIGSSLLNTPGMPYSAAAYRVEFHAYYHEFGRFLADFENSFPYMSIHNLQVSPVATPGVGGGQTLPVDRQEIASSKPEEREKLVFSMFIVLLFRPGNTP